MLTKDDLKVLQGVIFTLEDLEVDNHIINDLVEIYNKCVDIKEKEIKRIVEYNKEHKEWKSLINKVYYYNKTGNQAKVKEIKSRLERLKDTYDKEN